MSPLPQLPAHCWILLPVTLRRAPHPAPLFLRLYHHLSPCASSTPRRHPAPLPFFSVGLLRSFGLCFLFVRQASIRCGSISFAPRCSVVPRGFSGRPVSPFPNRRFRTPHYPEVGAFVSCSEASVNSRVVELTLSLRKIPRKLGPSIMWRPA